MTALFSGVCFTISTSNTFIRGPLGYTCHVVSAILLLYLAASRLVQELKGEGVVRRIKNINTQIKKTSEQIDKKAAQKQASAMK